MQVVEDVRDVRVMLDGRPVESALTEGLSHPGIVKLYAHKTVPSVMQRSTSLDSAPRADLGGLPNQDVGGAPAQRQLRGAGQRQGPGRERAVAHPGVLRQGIRAGAALPSGRLSVVATTHSCLRCTAGHPKPGDCREAPVQVPMTLQNLSLEVQSTVLCQCMRPAQAPSACRCLSGV